MLTAANLCISTTLNSTAHLLVAAKLYFFFTIAPLRVNRNFPYLLHAKGCIMKRGSNPPSETIGVS